MRFTLKSDFIDEFGRTYRAGQQGRIVLFHPEWATNCVEFDGYDEERKRDAEFAAAYGEGANIVAWMADIPTELLDVQDERLNV